MLLAQGPQGARSQSPTLADPERQRLIEERCRKELASLVEDVGALVLVFLQHSRLHRSSVAEHILQSRPVLFLRETDDGA